MTKEEVLKSKISLGLIEKNLDPGKFENKSWLFTDVTKSFEREKIIDSVLSIWEYSYLL
jgi:hypothetical protein